MQHLAKSIGSFTWAMSLFGFQQAMNVVRPIPSQSGRYPATDAFQSVADATAEQLGNTSQRTLQTIDGLQGQIIDIAFGMLPFGFPGRAGEGANQAVNPLVQLSGMLPNCGFFGWGDNTPTGWGPMPPLPIQMPR